jgi:two-component system, chemotaxis family, chemotaxis protein CheY
MVDATGMRVLVVDDAGLVRLFYRSALEACGFEVDEALNGLEALEKLLAAPFDLLVVDVNMPQMDGLTFVASVRNLPSPLASTPVLITSTESGPLILCGVEA